MRGKIVISRSRCDQTWDNNLGNYEIGNKDRKMKKASPIEILGKIMGLGCRIRKEWEWPKNGSLSNHLGFRAYLKAYSKELVLPIERNL